MKPRSIPAADAEGEIPDEFGAADSTSCSRAGSQATSARTSDTHAPPTIVALVTVRFRAILCSRNVLYDAKYSRRAPTIQRVSRREKQLTFPFEFLVAFHGVDDEAGDRTARVLAENNRRAH